MSGFRGNNVAPLASDVPDILPATPAGVWCHAGKPASNLSAAALRVRAASAFLLNHPSLLLPVASDFDDRRPIFESSIRGPSMQPSIPSRARLRVRLLGQHSIGPGDIAFFLADEGYMVHRVAYRGRRGAGQGYVLTCGDNHLAPDPPVQNDRVLGIVIAVHTNNGWHSLGSSFDCRVHRKAVRALTLVAMIATLWCSVAAAQRLAEMLFRLELGVRAMVRFFRLRLRIRKPKG